MKPSLNKILLKQPGLPRIIYKNLELINFLDSYFKSNDGHLFLTSKNFEKEVLFEPFIEGREFSCIMIEDKEGAPLVLPPTELISLDNNLKSSSNPSFDYRAKYLPGITSKSTPMDISYIQFLKIAEKCKNIFEKLYCNIYARIDGFLTKEGYILLNDPNYYFGNESFFFFVSPVCRTRVYSHTISYIYN